MIYKEADNKEALVTQLEELLELAGDEKRALVERELWNVRAGIKGEKEAAYLIDFHLKDSKKTAVIHDLRLELPDGRAAQIDHLLIHFTYQFFALETKHFSHGVKITEQGEFLSWNDWKKSFDGMPSPLEQGERHAIVLRKALAEIGMAEPAIEPLVLIAPKARIDRPKKFDTSKVVKADQFIHALHNTLGKKSVFSLVGGLIRTRLTHSIEEIAQRLVELHKPASIDYWARFGIEKRSTPTVMTRPAMSSKLAGQPSCRQCNSQELAILYGKYGYYFKCGACTGNTPIVIGCGKPDHKERIRKQGDLFFRECAACGTSALYFKNPAARR